MSPTFCWELATAGLVIAVGLIGYVIAEQRRHRAKLRRGEIPWVCKVKCGAGIGNPRAIARVMLRDEGVTAEEIADDRMHVDDSGRIIPFGLTRKTPANYLAMFDHQSPFTPGEAKARNKDPHDLL